MALIALHGWCFDCGMPCRPDDLRRVLPGEVLVCKSCRLTRLGMVLIGTDR